MATEKNNKYLKNFIENIYLLSPLAKFNTERRQLLLLFYDFGVRSNKIFQMRCTLEDILNFCKRIRRDEDKNLENARASLIEEYILTMCGAIPRSINAYYLTTRYSYLDKQFKKIFGFSLASLINLEFVLYGIISGYAERKKILNDLYVFNTKEEYTDLCFVAEPNYIFKSLWNASITIPEKEIVNSFINFKMKEKLYLLDSMDENFDKKSLAQECRKILNFLSDQKNIINKKRYLAIYQPLIKIDKRDCYGAVYYVIPFFHVLVSTTQFRVEEIIKKNKKLKKSEEKTKGKIVEFLTNNIFQQLPYRNIITNFRYYYKANKNTPVTYETDLLLVLNKSLWAVEIKSHSAFKNISESKKLSTIFTKKVKEGFIQGMQTLNYLLSKKEMLFSLGVKTNSKYIFGTMVLLDGFVPTLFTQNEFVDSEIFNTSDLYKLKVGKYRLYSISIIDLFVIVSQYDKNVFEDFLIWRTEYLKKFPIISYDEKEYWAYYEGYREDKNAFDVFHNLLEKEAHLIYTSARFNDKKYLEKISKTGSDNEITD